MLVSGFVGHGKVAYANFCQPKDVAFTKLWNDAYQAGLDAVAKANVQPMVVVGGGKRYFVADGVCGFAWVTVKPGNSAFAKWGKAKGLFSAAYGGGVQYWIGEFDQSMQRKEAFARAVADYLRANGVNAFSGSRMD